MDTKVVFPVQHLTLFREEVKPEGREAFTVTRGRLRTLPPNFGEDGFKPVASVYARGQSKSIAEKMASLLTSKGVAANGNAYGCYGVVKITASVVAVQDFDTADGVPCKDYRLRIESIERAEDAATAVFDAQF